MKVATRFYVKSHFRLERREKKKSVRAQLFYSQTISYLVAFAQDPQRGLGELVGKSEAHRAEVDNF